MYKIILLSLMISTSVSAESLSSALNAKINYLNSRQSIIAANIANASTPGYLAQDIEYKKTTNVTTNSHLVKTNAKHMAGNSTSAGINYERTLDKTFIRNDGNSVRTDEQMLKLANIQQEHAMATKLFAKHMAMQKLLVKLQ